MRFCRRATVSAVLNSHRMVVRETAYFEQMVLSNTRRTVVFHCSSSSNSEFRIGGFIPLRRAPTLHLPLQQEHHPQHVERQSLEVVS
ncbi:hypothetical protein Bxe_A2055 [Paraburkholderia xenovorans LB400]|uniref:Uncharacterized protein n=1 Tax=Paraburkholderia xenovorans (strain LB400) TaxID=266265 RepID=Q13YC6_PARXL|nr:hypothetical protein Bxe_A2055 [Paraburkholderia xenovorans LB400]